MFLKNTFASVLFLRGWEIWWWFEDCLEILCLSYTCLYWFSYDHTDDYTEHKKLHIHRIPFSSINNNLQLHPLKRPVGPPHSDPLIIPTHWTSLNFTTLCSQDHQLTLKSHWWLHTFWHNDSLHCTGSQCVVLLCSKCSQGHQWAAMLMTAQCLAQGADHRSRSEFPK